MIYQVGKKQCSKSGRKRNDIAPLESDFMVQPPSLLEFPGPLTPPPPWNFQFPPWWGSGYFLEPHNKKFFKTKIPKATVSTLIIYYLYTPTAVSSHNEHLQIFIFKVLAAEFHLHCIPTRIKAGDWS